GAYPYGSDSLSQPATSVRLHLLAVDTGLVVDAAGNVYFPELDNNLLQRINKVTPSGAISVLNTPLKFPNGIDFTAGALALSPSGLLYFSTFTQVYRLESSGAVTLIAGANGFPTNLGDGGPATAAKITSPTGLAFDKSGNLYIAENFASRVRKVTPQNIISTFAGTGERGYSGDGGPATQAKLAAPTDVKVDRDDNVYIADISAAVVRKVDSTGTIRTVAGNGTHGFSGDGGKATEAQLSGAASIAFDNSGNMFIADRSQAGGTFVATPDNNRIRMVNPAGIIRTIAGPMLGYNGEGVPAQSAAIGPDALASDSQGNIYTSESAIERVRKLTPVSSVLITSVNTAYGPADISQNDWIEIHGVNLAPSSVGPSGITWSAAPEFAQGRMPTQLSNVSVTINGKPAFVFFVSAAQLNVLTPFESTTGPVQIVVANGADSSVPFSANLRAVVPSFLRFGSTNYITATHSDYSLLGPASLSVPGYTFTPARPGETIVLYSIGFGLPASAVVNGSSAQSGSFATQPTIQVGGITVPPAFAGIISPGLTQINVAIPSSIPDGDTVVTLSYSGGPVSTATISVHR
ncbi:MAG: hypothetical protein ABI995_12780, partial [Acidobacteriota bacterium]